MLTHVISLIHPLQKYCYNLATPMLQPCCTITAQSQPDGLNDKFVTRTSSLSQVGQCLILTTLLQPY